MRSLFVTAAAFLIVVGGPLAATAPFEVSTGRPIGLPGAFVPVAAATHSRLSITDSQFAT